ncbi:MAG: T9SS type A sorting domain-containing protein [Bacteroidales bacterium]|nr:T9SS type A sorting domain-containing protein [Bacteroidales bacterium]
MKKIRLLILVLGLMLGTQALAQGHIDLGKKASMQQCDNVTSNGFTANFYFNSLNSNEVQTKKGLFSNITLEGTYPSGELGEPSLPAAHQLIAIPYGAQNVTAEIVSYTATEYKLSDFNINRLMPQQPSVRKDQKPNDIKFAYNEKAYTSKDYSARNLVYFEVLGTMRGIQVGSLTVNPVAYNPAKGSIMVYNDIEVKVSYNDYDKTASYNEFARTFSPYFATVYRQLFNWRDDVYDQHPDLWQAPVKMLVIADRMFEESMQEWIAWKTIKGFYMDVNYTDQIGNTASAIRNFIQGKYAQDAPTFVIIFGDKDQVAASAIGSETERVTDLYYMSVDDDNFPDIYHSRMCAETVEQMQNIIAKSLLYERYEFTDPSYLNNVLLVAGWDDYWCDYIGIPTIQYGMNYYYNAEHGYNEVNYFLGRPYDNAYASLNTGVSFANYTAHGYNQGWGEPNLDNNDIPNMTNFGKPFLAMGNCCQAADWGINNDCFGEAMIRTNQAAAYAYIGSCPSTYWYEDYYFAVGATNIFGQTPTYEESSMGVYDAVGDNNGFNTVASMPFIGNLAVCYAHTSEEAVNTYYWQAYHTLGDGSIMPFRVQPTENEVSHDAVFPIGASNFEISALPGSYVAVSKDGELHGAGLVDESGHINLDLEPVNTSGEVTICVTGLDKIPYIANIPAAVLEGPFIAIDSYTPNNPHVGEENPLSITFKNIGTEAIGGTTTIILTCDAPELTILNGTATFESLAPEESITINGFSYSIAEGVDDRAVFTLHSTATCGNNVWEGKTVLTAWEAKLQYESMDWVGGFVPGETVSVVAYFLNKGHYRATNAVASIASTSEYITIESETAEIGTIDPNGEAVCMFNVMISPDCPETEILPLNFTLNADNGLTAEGNGRLRNACNVVFELSDNYGDGWNDAYLTVTFDDDTPSENLTIENGSFASYTLEIGNHVHVSLLWTAGGWDGEVSFVVRYEDGEIIYQHGQDPQGGLLYEFDCDCHYSANNFSPIENLTATVEGYHINLEWEAGANPIGYIVYRNGIQVGETTETTFIDEVGTEMTYTYCVVAEYEGGLSYPECVQVEFHDGFEENEKHIAIYPNPTSNLLNINIEDTDFSFILFNGMGQAVAKGDAHGMAQIHVEDIAKGVYFLHITSKTQAQVVKVIIE